MRALCDPRVRADMGAAARATAEQHSIDRFIDENVSAYQMPGKLQGSYSRGRSQAADLVGWALLKKNDVRAAAEKLEEAQRLNQGQDFTNQFHLAELERMRNDPDEARAHLLNALSLTSDRKSTRLNSSHIQKSRMPSSA